MGKYKIKKSISLLIVCFMIFTFAACGNENTQQQESNHETEAIDSTAENGVLQSDGDPVSSSENDGLQNESNSEETIGDNSSEGRSVQGSNILVAYFSRVGNTVWEDDVDAVTSASLNIENNEFVGNAEYLAHMVQEATGGDLFLIQTEESYPSDYRETTSVASEEQADNARPALVSHVENMDQYDTIVLIYPNWWGTLPQPLFTFLEEYDFSGKTILPLCTHEGSRMGSSERAIAELCPDATLLDGLAVRGSDASSAQSDVETWIDNSGILN